MDFNRYSLVTLIGLCLIFLSACATNPPLPSGDATTFYKQDGMVETFYEQVTDSNAAELQTYLSDETSITKWRKWDWNPKVKFLPDDELWYFSTDPESWKNLAGRMGFCVFRNEKIIASYNTMVN